MLEDTLEGLEDTDELEEAAQQEVDKVCFFRFFSSLVLPLMNIFLFTKPYE